MEYTVVIRSLGKAGNLFQQELDSLAKQTIKPSAIIIYIAEGYDIPTETIGVEKYVYVKKGMVAQRALRYDDVETPFILFLDDDVYLPPNGVELLYNEMLERKADVISPCVFFSEKATVKDKIRLSFFGKEVCRVFGHKWAFKILRTTGISYNNNPGNGIYESQANGGPCFFCYKSAFTDTHFEDELWLDKAPYAFPEDHVMFYKMHLRGHKVLTTFDSGIIHLDAGTTLGANTPERIQKLIYSEYRNRIIFWHRFIYSCERSPFGKLLSLFAICYSVFIQYCKIIAKTIIGNKSDAKALQNGLHDGWAYLKTDEYKKLPKVL